MSFVLLFGCERGTKDVVENVEIELNDTIFSDSGNYYPLEIENNWKYVTEEVTFDDILDSIDETTYLYDTLIKEVTGIEYIDNVEFFRIEDEYYHVKNGEYFARMHSDYDSTVKLWKFLDANLETGDRWWTDTLIYGENQNGMELKLLMGYKILDKDIELNLFGNNYENVIKIAEYKYHPNDPNSVEIGEAYPLHKYYALGVGLIKIEWMGPFSSDVSDLLEYNIN